MTKAGREVYLASLLPPMLSGDDDGDKDDHLIAFKQFVIVVTIAKPPLQTLTTT